MNQTTLTVVIFLFGGLCSILFWFIKRTFEKHEEEDKETRRLVLSMHESVAAMKAIFDRWASE